MNNIRKVLDYASLDAPPGEMTESLIGSRQSIMKVAREAGLSRKETAELILANTDPKSGLVWISETQLEDMEDKWPEE